MKWFNVGKIVNTHGVKGEVRVISTTDFPEERYRIGQKLYLFQKDGEQELPLKVASHRKHKQFDLLTFAGYSDISDVELFKGGILKIAAEQRGEDELGEHEYYYDDIIGCTVLTEEGERLGTVTEIFSPGANDVWVVQSSEQDKPIYIPYIEPVVKNVDPKKRQIIIHLMEGLIE